MTCSGFHVHFEKIARWQTRSLRFRHTPGLPDGDFAFMPMYCDDKKCDCRRTLLGVLQVSDEFVHYQAATISFGWENMGFYRKWGFGLDEDMLKMFKGPALDYMNQQSPHAEVILRAFQKIALTEEYIERLKRQYAIVKYRQGMKMPPDMLKILDLYGACPCGSGNAFVACCGRKGSFHKRYNR